MKPVAMRACRIAAIFLGVLAAAFSVTAATDRHVILITIDGAASYYLNDTNASLPTLRRLMREGASAAGVRVSNPAITWPNHTTLLTGVHPEKHSVLFNGKLSRPGPSRAVAIDGARDKTDLVAVPTLYDLLHKAGYRTADINWPCTRAAASLDDSFPDVPDQIRHMTPRLREELVAKQILEAPTDAAFKGRSAAMRDWIWTAAATHVIRTRRPNFMAFHMLVCDAIQHRYGPASPAAYTAMALADSQLAEVLRALDDAGIRDKTTILVTADHGFDTALKIINPNVTFRKAGLLETGTAPGILRARAQIVSEGGIAFVYLTDPATADADRDKVRELMAAQEGIADIITPDRFSALGLPDPAKNRQMGDLILTAKPGYAFNNEARGENPVTEVTLAQGAQGHHGFLSTNPKMNSLFVAWGRGIKTGARLDVIDNIDIAPTMARLLGEQMPGVDGRVLEDLLEAGGR